MVRGSTSSAVRQARKKSRPQQIRELTDEAEGLEAGFITTYQPARYEGPFLLEAIRPFYDLALIVDVLANVKGGKEANVYRCRAEPSLGVEYLAAKVYRPRKFRNLRNDKMYREGRQLLLASGREVKANERRIVQAVQKKTEFGIQIAHSSWLMYEYTTLEKLRADRRACAPAVRRERQCHPHAICGRRRARRADAA